MTTIEDIPTAAYEGEKKNDDGLRVSVLRWHFEGDDIQYNKQELIQREMAEYAVCRELEQIRDRLLEVADQPNVETFKEQVKDGLNERIANISKTQGDDE